MAKSTNTVKYPLPSNFSGYPNNTGYNFRFFDQDGNLTLYDTLQSLLPAVESTTPGLIPRNLVNNLENLEMYNPLTSPTESPIVPTNPGFFSRVGSGIKSALGLSPAHTLEELQAMGPEKLEALKVQNGERLLNRQAFGQTLQGLNSLMSGYFGYQGMKQAQDALDFQKASWAKNYAAQRTAYNNELAANKALGEKIAGTYSDDALAKYMAEKGIK